MSAARIRVLVIDDSALSRRTIVRMLERSPLIEVVDCASDGEEALRKTLDHGPDLITLDLDMPRMDGFTYLRLVMSRRPTPVLVVSGQNRDQDVFKALELGAVDFIPKPVSGDPAELERMEQELLRKVHAIRQLRIEKIERRLRAAPTTGLAPAPVAPPEVVAIGSSTGGPAALMDVFGSFLEPPAAAFLVAQHMPPGFTSGLARRLDRLTPFRAREAEEGDEPEPGCILVAPGGLHLELEPRRKRIAVRLVPPSPSDKYVPSVDRLFACAAKHYGAKLMAIVLTGMGDDGCEGVRAVKQAGGSVIAESEESAVIYGMPRQAIRTGAVDRVLALSSIAGVIHSGVVESSRSPAVLARGSP